MSARPRNARRVAGLAAVTLLAASLLASAPASAVPTSRETLLGYARDTWRSMTAMVDSRTGLPADNIDGDLSQASRSAFTSPTNVGGYLWSTVVMRDLGLVPAEEAHRRLAQTLTTLQSLRRNDPSGMFYNWYDPHTGAVVRIWPEDGHPITPFLSSVDNGWLAAALMTVRNADPSLRRQANDILGPMDFGQFYDAQARPGVGAGELRGGFWDRRPTDCSVVGNYRHHGPDVWYTCNHYDVLNSEPRIATYIAIARRQIPAAAYFATYRTFPSTCDWSWQQMQPVGHTVTYKGIEVFEGAYRYRGLQFVPTWGGDMFEALMPGLFVPEKTWGTTSWAINHPAYVQGQIAHGLGEAGYGYWGFSPSSDPKGGYTAFGVPELGMNADGYPSDEEQTTVDSGFGTCRPAGPQPHFGDGVVTPHASFLALEYAPVRAMDNLAKLRANFDAYGPGGFYDAVAVRSGTVAKRYLSLDQAMVIGSLGNYLAKDDIRRYFSRGQVERVIRPLLGIERFNARPISSAVTLSAPAPRH